MMSLPSVLARADELIQRLSVQPDRKPHPSFPPLRDSFYISALSVPKQIAAVALLLGVLSLLVGGSGHFRLGRTRYHVVEVVAKHIKPAAVYNGKEERVWSLNLGRSA
jgi:hypothetical protein